MKRDTLLQALTLEELQKVPEIYLFADKTDLVALKELMKKWFALEEKMGVDLNKILNRKIMVDQEMVEIYSL